MCTNQSNAFPYDFDWNIFPEKNVLSMNVMKNTGTGQLPIRAGHCPWGGFTDRNVGNIYGEVLLASCRI